MIMLMAFPSESFPLPPWRRILLLARADSTFYHFILLFFLLGASQRKAKDDNVNSFHLLHLNHDFLLPPPACLLRPLL